MSLDVTFIIEEHVEKIRQQIAELKMQESTLDSLQDKVDDIISTAGMNITDYRSEEIRSAEEQIDFELEEVGMDCLSDHMLYDDLSAAIDDETNSY